MDFEHEDWRDVVHNPMYAVSDLGRVVNTIRGHILQTRISNSGYERIGLMVNGRQRFYSVHRLVAEAFLSRPVGTTQVNHIDGDKTYNVVENLEWVTASENHRHAYRSGLKVSHNERSILIVETGEIFTSIRACARAIGGIPQGVHNCLQGRFHTYFGYTFEYVDSETLR